MTNDMLQIHQKMKDKKLALEELILKYHFMRTRDRKYSNREGESKDGSNKVIGGILKGKE